jgi:hypothetical protein
MTGVTHESMALETVMEVVKTAEATAEEGKRRKTKTRIVGIKALTFEVSGIVTVAGRKAEGIGGCEEVARRARRINLRGCRRRDKTKAAKHQERAEPAFAAFHWNFHTHPYDVGSRATEVTGTIESFPV